MISPLTPVDCDLRDTKYMPFFVQQMLNSSFNSMLDDTAWRAGVTLWLKSWHQLPAGSLPDADDDLVGLAGFGRDIKSWRKVREKSLRGWIKCDDGRLYHPLIAEAALEAWIGRLLGQISSGAGNARRWGTEFDATLIEQQIEAAYPLLKALNPQAEAVKKLDRRKAQSDADKKPSGKAKRKPSGNPDVIPPGHSAGSQGEGEGKVTTGEDISNEIPSPSVAGAKTRKDARFSDFFNAFPRKDTMFEAEIAWGDLVAGGTDPAEIIAGMDRWIAKWRTDGTLTREKGRFLPSAVSWLQGRRWLDPIDAHAPVAAKPRRWSGPEAIRDAVVLDRDEAFAVRYLDGATWDPGPATEAIVVKSEGAAAVLRNLRRLSGYKIRVEEARAA